MHIPPSLFMIVLPIIHVASHSLSPWLMAAELTDLDSSQNVSNYQYTPDEDSQ